MNNHKGNHILKSFCKTLFAVEVKLIDLRIKKLQDHVTQICCGHSDSGTVLSYGGGSKLNVYYEGGRGDDTWRLVGAAVYCPHSYLNEVPSSPTQFSNCRYGSEAESQVRFSPG